MAESDMKVTTCWRVHIYQICFEFLTISSTYLGQLISPSQTLSDGGANKPLSVPLQGVKKPLSAPLWGANKQSLSSFRIF